MLNTMRRYITKCVMEGAKLNLSFCVTYRGLADLSSEQLKEGLLTFYRGAEEFAKQEKLNIEVNPIRERFLLSIVVTPEK